VAVAVAGAVACARAEEAPIESSEADASAAVKNVVVKRFMSLSLLCTVAMG